MSDWHRRDIADVLRKLRTDRDPGLSDAGGADRLRGEGPDELPGGASLSPWRIPLSQFASTMTAVAPEARRPVAVVGQDCPGMRPR